MGHESFFMYIFSLCLDFSVSVFQSNVENTSAFPRGVDAFFYSGNRIRVAYGHLVYASVIDTES